MHVVVLLPVLNEAEGLRWVLERLPTEPLTTMGHTVSVLVMDGHSTDMSAEVAAEHRVRFVEQEGEGKGNAIRQGFQQALDMDAEAVVMLDADGTYAPAEMVNLLMALTPNNVVIGDRLRGDMAPDAMTRTNFIGNHLLTWFASAIFGTATYDVCSGYWAFSRHALEQMLLNSEAFEIEAEMFASMVHQNIPFTYRPISYRARMGEAKLGSTADGWNILRKLITRRLLPEPLL
jgi:glycosyltransferase involved in cell wall biosynthesis